MATAGPGQQNVAAGKPLVLCIALHVPRPAAGCVRRARTRRAAPAPPATG